MTSVDNLRDISEHTYLRTHVQRIDFVHPKLEERYCEASTYMEHLTTEWKHPIRWSVRPCEELPYPESFEDRRRRQDELVKRSKYPWSSKQIYEGLTAYRKAYDEQKFIVEELFEDMVARRYLPKFPKFKLVRISRMENYVPVENDTTWLRKNHPDVLIRNMDVNKEDHDATNHFVATVLNVFTSAKIKPLELSLMSGLGCGIGPNFRWTDLRDPTAIEELQTFDLYIRGKDTGDAETVDPDWGALIKPIQWLCTRIERLYIHVHFNVGPADADFDEILDIVRCPKLKDFHLDKYRTVSSSAFADFLKAHPLLEEISHGSDGSGLMDQDWCAYWKALGEHANLSTFTLSHEPPSGDVGNPLWIWTSSGRPELDDPLPEMDENMDAHMALYNYIHKKGPWTEELTELWR